MSDQSKFQLQTKFLNSDVKNYWVLVEPCQEKLSMRRQLKETKETAQN